MRGQFAVFVDGFDEMKSVADDEDTIFNFRELAKLTFENVNFLVSEDVHVKRFNKIFLTCRTHYFFTEKQEKSFLSTYYTVLYRDYVTKTRYEIARTSINLLKDDQIAKFVFQRFSPYEKAKEVMDLINKTYNLLELAHRPLLLNMISESVDSLQSRSNINAAVLYEIYTRAWTEREDWRSELVPRQKTEWMWAIAIELFTEQVGGGVDISRLKDKISRWFACEGDKEQFTNKLLSLPSRKGYKCALTY